MNVDVGGPEILIKDKGSRPIGELIQAKEGRGELETLTIEAPNWVEAHRQLGEKLGGRITEIVETKMPTQEELTFANGIRKFIEAKAEKNSPTSARIKEYLDCLQAWGEGAKIKPVEGFSVLDMAIWLQNDNVGCQTLIYKGEDGGIYVLHTEEEATGPVEKPTGKADKPRLVTFKVGGAETKKETTAFMYPDLLPGAAFGWQIDGNKTYFQAIDALFLKEPEKPASLANMLAWLALTGGEYDNMENLIEACGPYIDGYAINMVKLEGKGNKPRAKRVIFAKDKISSRRLNLGTDRYSFQGNDIPGSDRSKFWEAEDHNEEDRPYYRRRPERMKEILRLAKILVDKNKWKESFFEVLKRIAAFRVGGEFALANKDVVGVGIAKFSAKDGFRHEVIAGPAMKNKETKEVT